MLVWLPLLLFAQPAEVAEKSERAQLWLAQQRFADAAVLYEELTRALPGNAGMLVNLGMARHMAGQDAEAIAPLEASLRIRPVPQALLFLGASYLRTGQPAKAIAPLKRLAALEPNHPDARRMLAEAAMSAQDHAEAAVQLRKLSEIDPSSPGVWASLGRTYAALGAKTFETLSPVSGYFFALAADARAKENRDRAAFLLYRKALEKLPRHRGLHRGLAVIYLRTGHADWAKQEEAAEAGLGPLNCRARPGALECQFEAGRLLPLAASQVATSEAQYWRIRACEALARQAMAKLGDLAPSAESWRFQAEWARDQGRHGEALRAWHAAHSLAPADESIELGLASGLIRVGDYDEARAIADRLLGSDPESPEFNFLMGDLLLSQQQTQRALPYLRKAATFLPARAALGRALMRAGRPGEAAPHFEAALPIDRDASLHGELAKALEAAGRLEEAAQATARYKALQAKLGMVADDGEITAPSK
jgi:predicted Zn-dependent protease